MKVYYRIDNGEVLYAVYGHAVFSFKHSTNTPLDVLGVDEIEANRLLCVDLSRNASHVDDQIRKKYYVQDGDLHERDGWVRYDMELN